MDRKKKFEKLCGPGSVHSAHVMVDGLKDLDGLCAQRNKAQDALEDAISKRAKLAAVLAADADARLRKALDARAAAGDDRARAGTWFGFRSDSDPESPGSAAGRRCTCPGSKFACKNDEPRDDAPEADLIGLDEQVTEDHGALYATAGGEIAKTQRRGRTRSRVESMAVESLEDAASSVASGDEAIVEAQPTWRLALPAVRRREAVDAIPRHANCRAAGPRAAASTATRRRATATSCTASYYEQLVAELNQAILREHFEDGRRGAPRPARARVAGVEAELARLLLARRRRGLERRRRGRPTESPEQAGGKASSPERARRGRRGARRVAERHERQRHRIMGGQAAERHWMAVLGAEPCGRRCPTSGAASSGGRTTTAASRCPYCGVAKAGLFAIFRDYLCGGEKETLLATAGIVGGRDASFAPSGTAFVAFCVEFDRWFGWS
ncbi:hypothetical protein JL720_14749 [Aureococcus anophagefferens]|nr:hypothetical protein JL720_14749 [Aureococcus anophagefferens]